MVFFKIGTDIEDFKCSWLVVQALEHADENQKKLLTVGGKYQSVDVKNGILFFLGVLFCRKIMEKLMLIACLV